MTGNDNPPPLSEARVTIVGLGLMGGSLALALGDKCASITAVTRRAEAAADAVRRGVVTQATTDLAEAVREADVVVPAMPVRAIIALLAEIGPALKPGCLVMDLGSTKREIVGAMDSLPDSVQAVGGHPMCGKETAGLDTAHVDLFRGRPFVLCPTLHSRPPAIERAAELVRAAGAHPVILQAERHDGLVATSSHLPYVLSAGLVATAARAEGDDPLMSVLLASGFRDTSRLAGSDATMMRDILLTNREAIQNSLAGFQTWLAELQALLEAGDADGLMVILARVQAGQRRLLS